MAKISPPIFVLPDSCYPFKVQTLNEQSLWNIPFYTHLIFVPQSSAIFVPLFLFLPLFLFHYFCSVFAYFCSAIFVPLTFLHLHLGSPSPNGQESYQFLFHQFLFHNFCSTDLFALALGVPVTQWPTVPTNFCSADLFALALSPPIFVWVTHGIMN